MLDLLSGGEHAILDIDVKTVNLSDLIDDRDIEILMCGSLEKDRPHFFVAGAACRLLTPKHHKRHGAVIPCPPALRDRYAVFYALYFAKPTWCEIGPIQCGLDDVNRLDVNLFHHDRNSHSMFQPQPGEAVAQRRVSPMFAHQTVNRGNYPDADGKHLQKNAETP